MKMIRRSFSLFLVLILSMAFSFCSFADVATSSDAVLGITPPEYLLSALSDDADAGIAPASTIGTVSNTVGFNTDIDVMFRWYDSSTGETGTFQSTNFTANLNGLTFKYRTTGTVYITGFYIWLKDNSNDFMPPYGTYSFSADLTSQFSISYNSGTNGKPYLWSQKTTENAAVTNSQIRFDYFSASGDLYIAPQTFNYTSSRYVTFGLDWGSVQQLQNFDATLHLNFAPVSSDASAPNLGGIDTSDSDLQNEISNNTSQIANSVSSMSSDLSDAAESLEYISNSQNLIIQGIDNVIMHISDQLYAFWDQLYNLIHVPTMAKLNEILQAIKDLDINVNVDLDDLKASINNMKTAIVSQITSSTNQQITNDNSNRDHLENGYDNSSMTSDKDRLDSSISEYEEVEDQLIEDAAEHISDFEFNNDLNEYIGPIQDISYFLQGIFAGMGSMNVAVSFSLTLSVALLLIGWYRFKGGS